MGSSYNDLSTFKQQLGRKIGKHDYFGVDDGRRDLPKASVKTITELSNEIGERMLLIIHIYMSNLSYL